MTKNELVYAFQKQTGGSDFITRREVAKSLGYKGERHIDKCLRGLDRIGTKYFIRDVATRIMEDRTW